VRNHRSRSLILLTLLLPLPARAALTLVGSPLVISESPYCSYNTGLEVTATPKGAFEAVWIDEGTYEVKGQRFTRNLLPTGSPRTLLPIHSGLFFSSVVGTWTGRYEVAMNVNDYDNYPDDPAVGYRVSLDLEGAPLAPAARFKPPRFFRLAPAAGGDSLQFRTEPPIFGPSSCPSEGLLAGRIDAGGAALGPESRITRRASAFRLGSQFLTERLPDDTFVAVYVTCEKFNGLVARHLNAAGAPVGNPINLPLPPQPGNFPSGSLALAARGGGGFLVGTMVSNSGIEPGGYTWGVVNGQVFGPTPIPAPRGAAGFPRLVDLAASPTGGYLLLFQSGGGDHSSRSTLVAQELDAQGVPRGAAVAVIDQNGGGTSSSSFTAAAASLPNGRWIIVARQQTGDPTSCSERLVRIVLAGE
jgi:hypothetical protein